MSLVKKEIKNSQARVKSTSPLSLPVSLEINPVNRIERRLKAFIANSDWIYEALNLIEKALNNNTELNTLDNWALERLDLTAVIENGSLILKDRYHTELTTDMLNSLKEKIIALTATYAGKLVKRPDLHHMERTFKKALRKSAKNRLTEEETNVLKEAYLLLENGKVVDLRGTVINLPRFNFLRLLIA
jgi:hypothetical protein